MLRKPLRSVPELKFSDSPRKIRLAVLERISKCDVEIWYVCLEKKAGRDRGERWHGLIYNDLAGILLEHILETRARNVDVTIDRSLSRANRERFDNGLRERMADLVLKMRRLPVYLSLRHVNSQDEPCIQAVDFVCGAVFRRHEHGDSDYYNVVRPKITLELMK
jgi:hypothetical protein